MKVLKSINCSTFIKIPIILFIGIMWTNNKQSKVTSATTNNQQSKVLAATIDGYSKNNHYTETFFHYPTRNSHCELQYERRMANQPAKTFRLKGKTEYQGHMYESSLNPFKYHQSHYEKQPKLTGDRKKTNPDYSHKTTDPITLTY